MRGRPITICEAGVALRAGETTSLALTETSITLANELDQRLGAYLARFDEEARERATMADEELAAGIDLGPLHGIPIGIKDILATKEGPTTAQSLILDPAWGEGRDAVVVERLRAAGAVITGKLTTMEFAIGFPDRDKPFPVPRLPWASDRWPGGSSSGSGVAVAAGLVLGAIGTDTAGSIRVPAAFCGITGLMPTFGRVPKSGCTPLGYSLDHVGPMARSARDCGAMLGVIAGPDPHDPDTAGPPVIDFLAPLEEGLSGLRIGVARTARLDTHHGADPAVSPAFEAALETLAALGAELSSVTIPHYDEAATATWLTMITEAFAYHRRDLQSRWAEYFDSSRHIIASGALVSGADYVQAQLVRRLAQRGLAELFGNFDLIAMPAASKPAFTLESIERNGIESLLSSLDFSYWNAVGNPTLVLPMGLTADGLPLALQLAARPFEEQLLVQTGDAFQAATDWHQRIARLEIA